MSATADLAVARSVIRKVFDGRYVDTTGVADLVTRGASVQLGDMNWEALSRFVELVCGLGTRGEGSRSKTMAASPLLPEGREVPALDRFPRGAPRWRPSRVTQQPRRRRSTLVQQSVDQARRQLRDDLLAAFRIPQILDWLTVRIDRLPGWAQRAIDRIPDPIGWLRRRRYRMRDQSIT